MFIYLQFTFAPSPFSSPNVIEVSHAMECSHCGRTTLHKHVCFFCGWFEGRPFTLRAQKKETVRIAAASKPSDKAEKVETVPFPPSHGRYLSHTDSSVRSRRKFADVILFSYSTKELLLPIGLFLQDLSVMVLETLPAFVVALFEVGLSVFAHLSRHMRHLSRDNQGKISP